MIYHPDDVTSWPMFRPTIIAHDVGRSRDRSTAVVGGNSPCGRRLLGIGEAEELPQGLFGSARASALAVVDRRYHNNALIVADLSNDATYGEVLLETFGRRVIGVHISRHGDGMNAEWRPTKHGYLPVYTIGRTFLIELFHAELQSDLVRFPMGRRRDGPMNSSPIWNWNSGQWQDLFCPPGKHDDLGISCAMLAWAARHPHLEAWLQNATAVR